MTVPFMLWCNVPMLQAIGTAAVIGFPIALSGTIGFVAPACAKRACRPTRSASFSWPALGGIVVASMLVAPLGAAAAHRCHGVAQAEFSRCSST